MGLKIGSAALAFCLFEETVDNVRGDRRDFLSTVTAGLSLSGIYSLLGKLSALPDRRAIADEVYLARHDVYTAARTARFGLKFGLAYGLLQDGFQSLKGNRPHYVEFLMGNRRAEGVDGDTV